MSTEKKEAVQSVPGWAWAALVAICLLLAILGGVKSCNKEEEAASTTATATATATVTPQMVEALVLDNECVTPCTGNIPAGKFKIRTEGHPIRVKFKGVRDWVTYPPEGDVKAPEGVHSGEAQFASPDTLHPNVRVQVYKKIQIPAP